MEDFNKQYINALLGYAVQRDLDISHLCEQSGIDYYKFQREKSFSLSPDQINRLWENASGSTDDMLFGLHFGESMQLAALGLIGQIIYTSKTVGEALSSAGGMIHLITDMFSIRVQHDTNNFRIHFVFDSQKKEAFPSTCRQMADYLMVFVLHELDGLVLEKFKPLAARFPYKINVMAEYERIFRCDVYQNSDELSLELPAKYLSLPIITTNYELQNILLQKVNSLTKAVSSNDTFQSRIFNYLMTNSYLYNMSLEAVATNFNMSPRSLQRKLKEEGATFIEIVEEVRKTLAIHYLKSGDYQVKDIAYILGYNESSAFLRAFKRWTGTTPTGYRRQMKITEKKGSII